MDTERIENGNGMDMKWMQNRYRMGMGWHAEWKQNTFHQALSVRFLLIGTVLGLHSRECDQQGEGIVLSVSGQK